MSMTARRIRCSGELKRTSGCVLPIVLCLLAATATAAQAQPRLVGRLGEANVRGQRMLVHVTVAVPPGANENDMTNDALHGQGARPIQPAEFTVTGLVWDQFFDPGADFVQQNYNANGAPLSADASLMDAQDAWTNVSTSRFAFASLGSTERCPSLVKECPGPQDFDGNNDIGWLSLSGCCTLAVTWYSTTTDEADIALNIRMPWTTAGGSGYDVQTVVIHENGHVLGLGHSTAAGSIMQATYAGVQRTLSDDDRRGVTFLYPEANAVGTISGTVISNGVGVAGVKVQIANLPLSTTTDSAGRFTFFGVPQIGEYSLSASAKGYLTATENGVDVGDSSVTIELRRRGK